MAYELLATGIKSAQPLDAYIRGVESRQNEQINQVNIDAGKKRNELAGFELEKARKQVQAETQWSKLPRAEDGKIDPQAEKQFKTAFPDYYDTRKKAEVAQLRDQIGLSADQFSMAATLFGKAKSPDDIAKAQAFAKDNFGMDIAYDEAVFGTVQKYSSDLAQKSALIQEDMAAAAADGDYATVESLKSALTAEHRLAELEVQKAQASIDRDKAAAAASNANAGKYKAQAEAARTGTKGAPLTVTQEIAVTKENERIAKQQQKKDLLISTTEETIDTIRSAIRGVGFASSGVTGKIAGSIPGTDTYDQSNLITTIKSNIGFDRLQAMRDASPTGGALGQVAIQELVALQASIASLDIGQTEAVQKKNLNKVLRHYENWKRTITGESVLKDSGGEKPKGKKTISFADLPE